MGSFTAIGDRCWVARWDFLDVNVGLVAGDRGLLVVDTNTSAAVARTVLEEVRRVSSAPILAAVNTHHHFDHTFGNLTFATAGAELVCHEGAATTLPAHAADILRQLEAEAQADDRDRDRYREIAETEVAVPSRTFSSAMSLDLGDRQVELVHPGRGHTDGDAVLRVPDAKVLFAGDLVEESALRKGIPGYGDDCWPMEWPTTLDLVLALLDAGSVVVPGHGAPVDQDFVLGQRSAIGEVAEAIRDLVERRVPLEEALEHEAWPYPRAELAAGIRRGYEQLPGARKSLPLI
ncbi:MAG: MBL fold metallo-hydrolase [Actinomycetota bacterium]|nr:MBL fold metallo-hydrolase [Actinomycetota bacterium]